MEEEIENDLYIEAGVPNTSLKAQKKTWHREWIWMAKQTSSDGVETSFEPTLYSHSSILFPLSKYGHKIKEATALFSVNT